MILFYKFFLDKPIFGKFIYYITINNKTLVWFMSIISVKGLKKYYNGLKAVDGISFEVKKGEIFGFLGPNGAGKTTTIKMLVTLLKPTDGTALVNGFDINKNSYGVRKSIGVVFQEPALDDELTGRENLDFHARMYGMAGKDRDKRIKEVLKKVDLEDKKDVLVKYYSGGMKRRLEIARGLMHYPRILFLDEPTLGLDPQTRRSIWSYIKELNKKEGITVFLTTHYMEEADYLCDRIAIIDHGKILVTDEPKKLKNKIGKDVITINCLKPRECAKIFEKKKWIDSVKVHDSNVILGMMDSEKKLPTIIKLVEKNKIKINSLGTRKPTLEDVFLYYTGRKIRDEESSGLKTFKKRFVMRR